ncbi:MAG: ABC transporter ATP-binding protein [Candidatus Cloacimonadales bacterium]
MRLAEVSLSYQENLVIDRLSLSFEKREFCALLGPNGAGKSTLLKSMIGYLQPTSGQIYFQGKALSDWNRKKLAQNISLIPQDFMLQFDHQVQELILMGRFPYLGYWQNYSATDYQVVQKIIAQLDLQHLAEKKFSQLSGGERQRVAIGRALAQEADTILLDEAFSHLDLNHQIEIMQLLAEINRQQQKQIILVSHNINLAAEYCDRVIMLKAGKLIADGSPEEVITQSNIAQLYGSKITIRPNPLTGKPNLIYPGISATSQSDKRTKSENS